MERRGADKYPCAFLQKTFKELEAAGKTTINVVANGAATNEAKEGDATKGAKEGDATNGAKEGDATNEAKEGDAIKEEEDTGEGDNA